MTRKSNSARDVFLNFPFDARYGNLYLALIAGTTALGMKPRCVLEIETTTDRLNRLLKLISSCQYSIHDLSRVQLDAAAPGCPRFNMPFELHSQRNSHRASAGAEKCLPQSCGIYGRHEDDVHIAAA